MPYMSSTSTSPNVPVLMFEGFWRENPSGRAAPPALWSWQTSGVSSDIDAAGFISDGLDLGMKRGDWLIHSSTTDGVVTGHAVHLVGSTMVKLSIGTTIGLGA